MRLVMTDSGLGGLSVCAWLVAHVKAREYPQAVDIRYVNAVPSERYGYNSMSSRTEKLITFNRFLVRIQERYQPDLIYIACNTLSVIYPATDFAGQALVPVTGIIPTGMALFRKRLKKYPAAGIIIMAAETTLAEGTYSHLLRAEGLAADRIRAQACPGLATTISNDITGRKVTALVTDFALQALNGFAHPPGRMLVYLGCTHYGYRKRIFRRVFARLGLSASILNPNEYAHLSVLGSEGVPSGSGRVRVEFISRYAIPEREVRTLTYYLRRLSPEMVTALRQQRVVPDLF